jgi:hypothetical protein
MNQVMHEYHGDDRKAVVRHTSKGFEVDLYVNDDIQEIREVHNHSESYAEDVAENYCLGMFDAVPNPNAVGYYGYNQKTDNFYPDIDD